MLANISGFSTLISELDVLNKFDVKPLILDGGELFCAFSKLIEDALTVLCPTSSFAILLISEALFAINLEKDDVSSI